VKVLAASSHPLRTDLTAPLEQKYERSQQAYFRKPKGTFLVYKETNQQIKIALLSILHSFFL